jgi:hypothetical protein
MVESANARRDEQPLRRVHSDGRVEDHGSRNDAGVAKQFLRLGSLVGDPGNGAELGRR